MFYVVLLQVICISSVRFTKSCWILADPSFLGKLLLPVLSWSYSGKAEEKKKTKYNIVTFYFGWFCKVTLCMDCWITWLITIKKKKNYLTDLAKNLLAFINIQIILSFRYHRTNDILLFAPFIYVILSYPFRYHITNNILLFALML